MLDHLALAPYQQASFGAPPYKPLREMPTYITGGDAQSYLNQVGDLITSLKKDMHAYLIVDDAPEDEDKAFAKLESAEKDDGCSVPGLCITLDDGGRSCSPQALRAWNGTGCPTMTQQEWLSTSETVRDTKRKLSSDWRAREKRLQAFQYKERANKTYRNAAERKVPPQPQDKDVDLWNSIYDKGGLDERWYKINSDIALYASGDDWKRIQSLDMDMQKARDEFTAITGKKPTVNIPTPESAVPEGKKPAWESGLEQLVTILKWGVVGIGIYYGGSALLAGAAAVKSVSKAPSKAPV